MGNNIAGGGNARRISDIHVVAVYDPESGRIAHLHTVTVFEGGRSVSEKEAVSAAMTFAQKAGHQVQRFKTKVSKDARHGKSPHRIDVRSGDFVAVSPEAEAKGSDPHNLRR